MDLPTVFTGARLDELTQMSVYAWKRKDDWLYVGATSEGLLRVLRHNIIGRAESIEPEDEILMWTGFADWEQAAAFEAELNQKHKPKYSLVVCDKNPRTCPICKKTFTPKRRWQKFCKPSCRILNP